MPDPPRMPRIGNLREASQEIPTRLLGQTATPNTAGTRSRALSNALTSATVLYAAKLARVVAVTFIRRCSGQAQW